MTTARVIVALIWIAAVAAGRWWGLAPAGASAQARLPIEPILQQTAPEGDPSGPRIDLYGNEIVPAIGDYRIDGGGAVYERHSPDTAIGKLPPPGA